MQQFIENKSHIYVINEIKHRKTNICTYCKYTNTLMCHYALKNHVHALACVRKCCHMLADVDDTLASTFTCPHISTRCAIQVD